MKVKTSVTLSEDLLRAIDEHAGEHKNRSDFLEVAAWAYLQARERAERYDRELALIDKNADWLNAEQDDVLLDQTPL